jgi:hypothetical protein
MRRNRTGVPVIQDTFYWTFYWIGMAMAAACIVLVLAGNTERLWRFEHAHIPLSCVSGIVAMLAFVMAEYCDSTLGIDTASELSTEAPDRELFHQESA